MKKFMLAASAIAVAATLAGCGRNDDAAMSTASTSAPASTSTQVTPPSDTSTAASSSSASDTSSTAASTSTTAPAGDNATTTAIASGPSGTAADAAGASPATTASTDASASNTSVAGAGPAGQTVYNSTCAMCHAAGVAGAPKPGDKADWAPRIAQGKETLYTHAIKGFTGKKGMMPPKGGNTAVPDADVKAAVDFMVEKSK